LRVDDWKHASSEVCTFGSMIADTGAVGKIRLRKLPYGKKWLVVGHFQPDRDENSDVEIPNLPGFEEPPPLNKRKKLMVYCLRNLFSPSCNE